MEERSAARVLTVCGSLQARSANRAALEVIVARLRAVGAELQGFEQLDAVPPFNPDRAGDDQALDPAVEALRDQVAWADAVVFAAPEYAGALAGSLKNALDWMVGLGALYAKPAAVVSAGTSGGEHARRDLIRTLTWQGTHVIADLGITAPRTKSDVDGHYTDADTVAALHRLADVVAGAPALEPEALLEQATRVVTAAGVDPGHLAPAG